MAAIYTLMIWHPSYCGLADDSFSIRTTARHTARVRERRNLRGRHRSELGCQLVQAIPEKQTLQYQKNVVTLGDAGRSQISVSGVYVLVPSQVLGAGSSHCGKSSKHLRNFMVGTLNVNTPKGSICEVVETLSRRKVDLCCVQETRGLYLSHLLF